MTFEKLRPVSVINSCKTFAIRIGLPESAVLDQRRKQPKIAGRIIRMFFYKFLVILNQRKMVACTPVAAASAHGCSQLAVRTLDGMVPHQCLHCVFCSLVPVELSEMVFQFSQKCMGLAVLWFLCSLIQKEGSCLLKLIPGNVPDIPDHVLDPLHSGIVRQGK